MAGTTAHAKCELKLARMGVNCFAERPGGHQRGAAHPRLEVPRACGAGEWLVPCGTRSPRCSNRCTFPFAHRLCLAHMQAVRASQDVLTRQKDAIIKDFAPEKKVRALALSRRTAQLSTLLDG